MADVSNIEFLDSSFYEVPAQDVDINAGSVEFLNSTLYEVPEEEVEKRLTEFLDSSFYEVTAQQIKVQVPNIEFLGAGLISNPPVIANVVPAGGSNILANAALTFEVTDDLSLFRELIVIASLPSLGLLEVVHMNTAFGPQYTAGSTRTPIVNGFQYSVIRNGGWPASPTLTIRAIDFDGSKAEQVLTWNLVPDTTPPVLYFARPVDATTVDITFSEPVVVAEATNPANYGITGGAGLTVSAAAQISATVFRLTTSPQVVGQSYLVTASNIHDLFGNLI